MSENYGGENGAFPILILTSQGDSHPFEQRTIVLNDVIKVGRSVARARPANDNAIFDCKVLSRSHALIWHKFGRFWLRDTNSSNGTFVNNTRVPKVVEPNSDREIFSGDIIRFGVEVVENETTHGCILARVTIYHADGVEAKPHVEQMSITNGPNRLETMYAEQVFRLAHSVGEALFREQVLESKLESLNRLLQDTRKSSEAGWQAMLSEERLLRKLDLYESQLAILKQDLPPDSLQAQLYQVLDEKCNLEKASEVMLARVLCEKTEALNKATSLECQLSDSERECTRLRQDCEATQEAYQSITTEHQAKLVELTQLEQQLHEIQEAKTSLEAQLAERTKEAEVLQETLIKKYKASKMPTSTLPDETDPDFNFSLNGMENGPLTNPEQLGDKVDFTGQLQSSLNQRADSLRDELALADLTELELQERLATSEVDFENILHSASDDVSAHLYHSVRQFQRTLKMIRCLQDILGSLSQLKLDLYREFKSRARSQSDDSSDQLDDFYAVCDVDAQGEAELKFSNALKRARNITSRAVVCHLLAEHNLSSYCAEQNRRSANVVPNASSPAPGDNPEKPDDSLVHSTASFRLTSPGKEGVLTLEAETQSSLDENEVEKLREDLRIALNETESFKQMAENLKQQDTAKSELLLTVREECDALRKRIASIEADVITSREDHQRLIAEARRTRSEADELRQERDTLNNQVNTCNQRIEQLQSALSTTLLGGGATKVTHSTNNFATPPAHETSLPSTSISPVAGSSFASQPPQTSGLRNHGSMVHLFAIIPVMVALFAIMVYIFSLLSR